MRAISSLVVMPGIRSLRSGWPVVAEVVQAKALRRTSRRARRAPRVGDTGSAGGFAEGAGEHHAVWSALGIGGEVVVERLDDDGRHDGGADACVGLWAPSRPGPSP